MSVAPRPPASAEVAAKESGHRHASPSCCAPKEVTAEIWWKDPEIVLTIIAGLCLALSFVPGLHWLAYASVVAGGWFAVQEAVAALRRLQVDVHLLMVLAAAGALATGNAVDAAALLFLFSLSHVLEHLAMAKTRSAISALVKLRPATALKLVDGRETEVPVESLAVGDLVRIPSFASIPLDGTVVEGASSVDESALSGESLPVPKAPGDPLISGTQNQEGVLTLSVTQTVGNSTLDRMIALVQDAQENKATGERISDWFGQRYTIFVIVAFLVSWLVRATLLHQSDAFHTSLVLLVALSPCALVISTPASTLSALTNAARQGILVRGGEFIESVASMTTVAMDKTGTLTEGKPRLRGMMAAPAGGAAPVLWSPGSPLPAEVGPLLSAVAGLEALSTHPLARAIVLEAQTAGQSPAPTTDSVTIPGRGIRADIDGGTWFVGSDALLTENGLSVPPELERQGVEWRQAGLTTAFAQGPGGAAVFAFGDAIRPDSAAVVAELKSLGVRRVVMLTGDKKETAQAIARQAGIDEVAAELLPGDKTAYIERLAEDGHVMMVGDGVNDAPSLARATIGVAMGGLGSDVALEAADVVLMNDNVAKIPVLMRLGKRTQRIIRANLAISIGMVVVLSVASLVTNVPLPLAVFGHEGSTVIVILNGLRLLRR